MNGTYLRAELRARSYDLGADLRADLRARPAFQSPSVYHHKVWHECYRTVPHSKLSSALLCFGKQSYAAPVDHMGRRLQNAHMQPWACL